MSNTEKQEIFAASVLRNIHFKLSRGFKIHQRFRCFPKMMVTSVATHVAATPPCRSHTAGSERVFVPASSARSASLPRGRRGAASPEVAFLLHREAIKLPRGARSRGRRDCLRPVLAGGFNRRTMPHCSQQVTNTLGLASTAAGMEMEHRTACKLRHACWYLYNIVLL